MMITTSQVVDVIHGVRVLDPFRWLEDRAAPGTEAWIREQQGRWQEYLNGCAGMDVVLARVHEYLTAPQLDQPAKLPTGNLFRRRGMGQEQPSIFVGMNATGSGRVLFDPSPLGPFASVALHHVSADGALAALELRRGGEDRKSLLVVDVATGHQYPTQIERAMVRGFAFAPDNSGYYCCHEEGVSDHHTIRFYPLIHPEDQRPVFSVPCPPFGRLSLIADEVHLGALLVRPEGRGFCEDFWIAAHHAPTDWHRVLSGKTLPFTPILKSGHIFAMSFDDTPNGRFVELSCNGDEIREVVPEQAGPVEQLAFSGNNVSAVYANGSIIWTWDIEGQECGKIVAPPGTSVRILPNYSHADVLFYAVESFTEPPAIIEYSPVAKTKRLWWNCAVPSRNTALSVSRSAYESEDGTKVEITVVQPSNTAGRPLPTIMTSYGGFGVPAVPRFSVFVSIMLELGFAFALPHVRGGGDKGKAWHEAGSGKNRQKAIDDFCAAAKWLIDTGIAEPGKLAAFGGSNSGLLVAAAMTQCPELFRGVLCIAPLLDMVSYERLSHTFSWRSEFGGVDEAEDFAALLAYSPYHRIEDETNYPAVLFVSGDSDERCHPAHVRKMAARLLSRSSQKNPVLIDYSEHRGHAPVMPLSVREQALAARIAFLCRELGVRADFRSPR